MAHRHAICDRVVIFPPSRSWFTQGLIESAKAGNPKARPLLRGMYDWFNDPEVNPYPPYLYDGISNGEQGQIASTRMYLESGVGVYADSILDLGLILDDVTHIPRSPAPCHPAHAV